MEPDHTPENGMLQHEIVEEELRSLLSGITIERELREHIEKRLERVGMYFRIFARVKAAGWFFIFPRRIPAKPRTVKASK